MCPSNSSPQRRQLTYEDRLLIEQGLNKGDRLATIARTLGRSQSTIAREVQRNWTSDPKGRLFVTTRNICVHAYDCEKYDLCKNGCMVKCRRCRKWLCNSLCDEFEALMCPKHNEPPYVCNNCSARYGMGCNYPYRFYEATYAHDKAAKRKSEARQGLDITQEAFEESLKVIAKGLKKGQSPAHIINANKEQIPYSASSFYRYLNGAKAKNLTKLDLPKAVRYRPRSKIEPSRENISRELLKGRTYEDFTNLSIEDQMKVVEMDTVVGRNGKDTQCILTLYFRRFKFQMFILMRDHTSEEVVKVLDGLQSLCGPLYSKLFGILLTDRGSEFADVERIEHGKNGRKRSSVYFCDPRQSQQKGGCERNHVELRRILPKGKTNFDALTNHDMANCMSHVNSYMRNSLGWSSPLDLAFLMFPPDALETLGVQKIDPNDINLTPYLVPHAML